MPKYIVSMTPRDYEQSVIKRLRSDPVFAKELLAEAIHAFLSGQPATSRALLHQVVKGTIGFELLSQKTLISVRSLRRMLSLEGNARSKNISAVFDAVQKHLSVCCNLKVVEVTSCD